MKKISIILVMLLWCGNVYAASISDLLGNFKSSDLPILQCTIDFSDGSKKTEFYDLEEIKRLDPTTELSTKEFIAFSKKDGEWTSLNVSNDKYTIRYANINNGFEKGYTININRKSGELEIYFPESHSVHIPFIELVEVISRAKRFNGVCEKKEKKNL